MLVDVHCKHHMAYFFVHSFASSRYFFLSVLYILAMSGTSGSSGFASFRSEQIDNKTETNKTNPSELILYIPVNNFSTISGWVFLRWTSTKQRSVLLKDTTQWLHRQWDSYKQPFYFLSNTTNWPTVLCPPVLKTFRSIKTNSSTQGAVLPARTKQKVACTKADVTKIDWVQAVRVGSFRWIPMFWHTGVGKNSIYCNGCARNAAGYNNWYQILIIGQGPSWPRILGRSDFSLQ